MRGHWGARGDKWACAGFGVTFEPRQEGVGAWQAVKGEAMPVDEACVIERTVWLD